MLERRADGVDVVALEAKHGYKRFEVWKRQQQGTGVTDVLGTISILNFASRPVYKATCRIHKGCECVINSLQESRLLEWLAVADTVSKDEHVRLSKELRTALGMRIRK